MNIHRIPTFIFKKDNNEIARIVEYLRNDLQTDVAQIALGVPSNPNYEAANYLNKVLDTDIETSKITLINTTKTSAELLVKVQN